MNKMRQVLQDSRGFTLIELIVVMVIIAILAIVAIPKYVDLTWQAKAASTAASLGAVRSTLAIKYAESAATTGTATFPASITAADFADSKDAINKCSGNDGVGTVATAPAATATSGTDGFWYIVATGQAGAYANASAPGASACFDTSTL
jgi:prepilin-type N-terminal cleavage/methylation domain-containing protein